MTHPIYMIQSKEALEQCPVFEVKHNLWNSLQKLQTFGQIAYLIDQGLYLRMTSLEQNPKRTLQNHRDMVCKDSAVEAFFAFPDPKLKQITQPSNDVLYLNFEINANGAMYAKYGHGRQGRQFLTDKDYALSGVRASIEPDRWTAELLIPDALFKRLGLSAFKAGDTFFCNFYKISEDPAIEHYAAFCPIPTETPNFHLPEYFARAEIVQAQRNALLQGLIAHI